MRIGGFLAGIGPASIYGFRDWFDGLEFQLDWAKRLGWRCFVPNDFGSWDLDRQLATVVRMAERDLVVPGLGGYQYNLLHPDPQTRAEHVRAICDLVERAAAIRVSTVEAVAGSRHPTVSYAAAPGNKTEEAWADFVKGCREVCAACKGTGVRFALEPFVATLVDSPAALKRAIEDVDRPEELAVNFDLVNFATPELAYDLRPVVDEVIEVAGRAIALVHIKDVRYEPMPNTHVWEVVPGTGCVDFAHWFARLKAAQIDVPAFIEHLSDMSQMVSAWERVRADAQRVGIL